MEVPSWHLLPAFHFYPLLLCFLNSVPCTLLFPPFQPPLALQEAFDHNWGYDSPAPQENPLQNEAAGGTHGIQGTEPEWTWLQRHFGKVEGSLKVRIERMEQRLEEAELRIAAYERGMADALAKGLTARKMLAGPRGDAEGVLQGNKSGRKRSIKCDSMSCELRKIAQYREPLTPPDEGLTEYPHLIIQGDIPAVEVTASSRIYFLEALPDRCAGVAHKRFSLTCAAAEARALGRQLAIHMTTCLSANHTGRQLNQWVPTAAYFDLAGIAKT